MPALHLGTTTQFPIVWRISTPSQCGPGTRDSPCDQRSGDLQQKFLSSLPFKLSITFPFTLLPHPQPLLNSYINLLSNVLTLGGMKHENMGPKTGSHFLICYNKMAKFEVWPIAGKEIWLQWVGKICLNRCSRNCNLAPF